MDSTHDPDLNGEQPNTNDEVAVRIMTCTHSEKMRSSIVSSTGEAADRWMETIQDVSALFPAT
jgi:hypothetical protein